MSRAVPKEVFLIDAMLLFAEKVAEAASCERASHGCVLTTPDLQVISYGYNGTAKGLPNKCDRPDQPGNCGCVHAEANAIAKAGLGPKMAFITGYPCERCAALLMNADVETVFYKGPAHREMNDGLKLLDAVGIPHGRPEDLIYELAEDGDLIPEDLAKKAQSRFTEDFTDGDFELAKQQTSKFVE